MKVIIEATRSSDIWQHRQTTDLACRIYANETFQAQTGEMWYAGSPFNNSKNFLPVPCALDGNVRLVIAPAGFEIDSTTDSPVHPNVRYSAWIFAGNTRLMPHLLGFPVPHTWGPNLTWTRLQQERDAKPLSRYPGGSINLTDVANIVAEALGELRRASETQIGMAAGTTAAVDPLNPIHVSVTDPLWQQLLAGGILPKAVGRANMVAGAVTVPVNTIEANDVPMPISLDDGISGALRAVNIIAGASFDVVSNIGADEGVIGWVLYKG